MNRLLIANRGEIAVRIIHACREMGISPVAVYSDADRTAPHVTLADAAVCIGPGPAAESYLCIDKVLAAACELGADAVHPGYGFLSENAAFAQACVDAGLTFVGPSPEVIRTLGDKSSAKRIMEKAGIPVVPGYHGGDQSARRLAREAKSIGFPVLIKAAAGGGGRGMRLVTDHHQFESLFDEARSEAVASFGDGRLLLEKFIERPRHIEVQIVGDNMGNMVHLMERECSIQRRHQKIIEESPSPALSPDLRRKMTEAAVAAGRAAGYTNAGTVEFLFDESTGSFCFLEVNTRLQVEHPVTELITGVDVVTLQLRIAAGEPIQYRQSDVTARGHAIEARIYAEDPAAKFLPSTGTLAQWIAPTGPGTRVDAGVQRGSIVSPYYDPMLAKLMTYGENRSEAIARMNEALHEFHILGVRTNVEYLLAIVRHPSFLDGCLSTGFLAEHFEDWKPENLGPPIDILLAVAAEAVTRPKTASSDRTAASIIPDPWRSSTRWRNAK